MVKFLTRRSRIKWNASMKEFSSLVTHENLDHILLSHFVDWLNRRQELSDKKEWNKMKYINERVLLLLNNEHADHFFLVILLTEIMEGKIFLRRMIRIRWNASMKDFFPLNYEHLHRILLSHFVEWLKRRQEFFDKKE